MIELKWIGSYLYLGDLRIGHLRQNPNRSYYWDFCNRLTGSSSQYERDMVTAMEKGYAEVEGMLKEIVYHIPDAGKMVRGSD